MDFAIKYLSDPVCPAFGCVRSRVCPFSYMLYILLQKDFYYSVPKEAAWAAFCGQTLTKKETGACLHSTIRLNSHPYEINSQEELKAEICNL